MDMVMDDGAVRDMDDPAVSFMAPKRVRRQQHDNSGDRFDDSQTTTAAATGLMRVRRVVAGMLCGACVIGWAILRVWCDVYNVRIRTGSILYELSRVCRYSMRTM